MACETLPADIQGCINIQLIRGDDKRIEMLFTDDTDAPIYLGDYEIKMEARQGGIENTMPVATFVPGNGMEIDDNKLTIVFAENSPIFQRDEDQTTARQGYHSTTSERPLRNSKTTTSMTLFRNWFRL